MKCRSDFNERWRDHPTFGQVLRGARLGWHIASKQSAFIRMSSDLDVLRIQVLPLSHPIPDGRGRRGSFGEYIVWWEDAELLDLISELRHVRRVKQPFELHIPFSRELPRSR